MRLFFAVLGSVASLSATASWQLDNDNSRLHFLSTKNAQVTEIHRFETLSGTLSDQGQLEVTIALDSVNTAIEIRNTRMRNMLFETASYPVATLRASLPSEVMALAVGEANRLSLTGTLSLHGVDAPVSMEVMVTRLSASEFKAATIAPTLVKAEDFALGSGVEALRDVAKLTSITMTVPVTFNVTFVQPAA